MSLKSRLKRAPKEEDTQAQRRQTSASEQVIEPSTAQLVLGDCVVTCIWAAGSSVFGEAAEKLHVLTGFSEATWNIALLVIGLALLTPVCSLFWGAMINPVCNLALVVSGKGGMTTNVMRMTGQLVGAVIGSSIATSVVPEQHRGKFHMLSGKLQDGIGVELGFACEAALVFCTTLVFLYLIDTSRKSSAVTLLAPHLIVVFVCSVGAEFTGPSLNPYLSFAWNSIYKQHSLTEHVAVFWLGPCAGAIVAALVWRSLGPSGDPDKRSSRSKAAGRAAAKALERAKKA